MGNRGSLLHRLTASTQHLDAADLRSDVVRLSCTPLGEIERGAVVTVTGRLRAVVYTPAENVPTLEAELYDGTSAIDLVWLGRRRIAGIEPGRRIKAIGRVGVHNGRLAIYNPWYELQSVA
ncbi:MAG: Nucleic acid binding OB-fold tRNA/helicase [Pseudonocardiales bacterium]|nr:Nucleic acid binding OB-fold tRNA/helicase [Pseudonocardiales bacterium]